MFDLWYRPVEDIFPGGYRSTYSTVEAALEQAVAAIKRGRTPGPDRIVDSNTGESVYDRAAIEKAAQG